jgi:hypothetical protein
MLFNGAMLKMAKNWTALIVMEKKNKIIECII